MLHRAYWGSEPHPLMELDMKKVLVVGSSESFIRNKLTPRLEQHGISVVEHWDWTSRPKDSLPQKTQGVILIAPEATSHLATSARSLARSNEVPCAEVVRKFSQAIPILERVGLIVPGNTDTTPDEEPSEGDIYESVLTYLTAELKGGREPTLSEVQSVLFRIYDQAVDLPRSVYKRALAAGQAKAIQQKQETQGSEKAEERTPYDQAVEWALLHIEERPELEDSDLASQIDTDMKDISKDEATQAVAEARDRFLDMCENWRKLPQAVQDTVRDAKTNWAFRFCKEGLVRDGDFPSYTDTREEAHRLFGTGIADRTIVAARREVEDQVDIQDPLPTEDFEYEKWIPRERIYKHYAEAYEVLGEMNGNTIGAISDWILGLDNGEDVLLEDAEAQEVLQTLNGNPMTFSILMFYCIPEDAVILKAAITNAYKEITGKGTDSRYIRAAAWATKRETREVTDPSYYELEKQSTSDVEVVENDDTEVEEAIEAIDDSEEAALKAKVEELESHNARLQTTYDDLFRTYKAEQKTAKKTVAQLHKALEEKKGLEAALDATEDKAADYINQIASLQEDLHSQNKEAKSTMMTLRGKLGASAQQVSRLEAEIDGLKAKVTHLNGQHTTEMGQVADQLQKAKDDRTRMKESRDKAREEAATYMDQVEKLEFRVAELEGKLEEAKKAAKAPQGGLTLRELVAMGYDVKLTAPSK